MHSLCGSVVLLMLLMATGNLNRWSSLQHPEGHKQRQTRTRSQAALEFKCCCAELLNVL